MARQLARRRHRERVAGISLAGLGAVVAIVAVIALREPNGHVDSAVTNTTTRTVVPSGKSTPAPSGRTKPATGTASKPPASTSSGGSGTDSGTNSTKSVPLVVLNNTTTPKLAQQAADRFSAGGWTVSSVGNLRNDIISTCAYYDPSDADAKPAAMALQKQFPTIKRVQPKFPELPDGPVVVVLTPDYSGG